MAFHILQTHDPFLLHLILYKKEAEKVNQYF